MNKYAENKNYYSVFAIFCLLIKSSYAAATESMPGPLIYTSVKDSAIRIQVSGVDSSDKNVTLTGSGFLVSTDGYAITSKHVAVPNYMSAGSIATVTVGSNKGEWYLFSVIKVDDKNDIALIKIQSQRSFKPLFINCKTEIGATSYVIGFPGVHDVNFTWGNVSGRHDPLLTISNIVNPGNSGGPVVDSSLNLIGMVKGYGFRNDGLKQEGISLIVPCDPIFAIVKEFNIATSRPDSVDAKFSPREILKSFPINIVKDDHPMLTQSSSKEYVLSFLPEEGYEFGDSSLSAYSDSKSTINFVKKSKQRIDVSIKITSGPIIDRYRGWYIGELFTKQVKK